jgi:fatty acid desaturase
MLNVLIDFEESHLFFPRIILGLLVMMTLVLVIRFLPARIQMIRSGESVRFFSADSEKAKVGLTLALLLLYFWAMDWVGAFFPNRGYGFLFCSIAFMLVSSFLFMGQRTKKKMIAGVVNSLLTPILAWLLFGQVFHITLP